jgi:hypothetical protein
MEAPESKITPMIPTRRELEDMKGHVLRLETRSTLHAYRTEPCQHHTHLQQVAAVNWSTGEGG